MAKKSSAISVMRRATGAMLASPMTVLLMVLPLGMLSAWESLALLNHFGDATQGDDKMAPLMLADAGINLGMEIFIGPIVAAMSIYLARAYSKDELASPYKALNFALNRYGRLLKWHAIAWLCIHFGLALICVPGILFLGMYAFVDPIICLEKEDWPLARSKLLSRGRRRTIFLSALPWLVVSQIGAILEFFGLVPKLLVQSGVVPMNGMLPDPKALETATQLGFVGIDSLTYLLLIWTYMCFTMAYEDRTTPASTFTAS